MARNIRDLARAYVKELPNKENSEEIEKAYEAGGLAALKEIEHLIYDSYNSGVAIDRIEKRIEELK